MKVSLAMEMENGRWEMGNGKQLKDNRQIYLNIPANSKPFFAVSFFVNYSFAPFWGGCGSPLRWDPLLRRG